MLRIAYCDDMQKDRDRIMSALSYIEEKWKDNFEIYSFNSGESLLDGLAESSYDIILLDILMGGIDGVKTAKSIRHLGIESKIVFISSCSDRIRELFSVGTVAFLDKPLSMDEFEQILKQVVDTIQKDKNNIFTYKANKNVYFLPLSEVKFFESKGQEIHIQTTKELITFYGSLKDVLKNLEDNLAFTMPHRSYVVNFKYVEITKSDIKIKNSDIIIPMGRGKRDAILDKFMTYMQRRGEI